MFTIDQILAAHSTVKSGADFPQYVGQLKLLGLSYYDFYVEDGRSIYYGKDDYSLSQPGRYSIKKIAEVSSAEKLAHELKIHQQGKTNFQEFCSAAADAGVEKWTTHVLNMEVIYYDKSGKKVVVETIPQTEE